MDFPHETPKNCRRHTSWRALPGAALAALILATAPCGASPQSQPEPAETVPMAALLSMVAAWINAAGDLPLPGELPSVTRASRAEMAAMFMGGTAGASSGVEVEATYNTETRTIYLPHDWTGATDVELSVLVHEMVHHLQTAAGRSHACPAEREQAAYAAQARWLEARGSNLEQAFGIDGMTLLVRTHCGI